MDLSPLIGCLDADLAALVLAKLRESVALRKVSDRAGRACFFPAWTDPNAALFPQG